MSRSYKKTPRSGNTKDRYMKRYANKKLRQAKTEEPLNHMMYKKNFCSYDICDYQDIGTTFEQFWKGRLDRWYRWDYKHCDFPNKKEEYQNWLRWYIRK